MRLPTCILKTPQLRGCAKLSPKAKRGCRGCGNALHSTQVCFNKYLHSPLSPPPASWLVGCLVGWMVGWGFPGHLKFSTIYPLIDSCPEVGAQWSQSPGNNQLCQKPQSQTRNANESCSKLLIFMNFFSASPATIVAINESLLLEISRENGMMLQGDTKLGIVQIEKGYKKRKRLQFATTATHR